MSEPLARHSGGFCMLPALAVFVLVATLVIGSVQVGCAAPTDTAEVVAANFVTAFQKGDWSRAQTLSADAALSWVEYVASRDAKTDGISSISKVESIPMGESVRAKVYYINADNQVRVRYLKLREIAGQFAVVDDKMMQREWVSLSYRKGLFSVPQQMNGIKITVLGVLEAPPEVKVDFLVENVSGPDKCFVYPSLESFYVVEFDGAIRQKYFANPPTNVPETVLARGEKMRSYAIFPYWAVDPDFAGRAWNSFRWTLYVPYGPVDQFVFDYM